MDFITSQFQNFTITSYIAFIIIIICFVHTILNPLKQTWNNPTATLIAVNIAFAIFMSTIPGNFDLYIQILLIVSALCLSWYIWIRVEEYFENKERGYINTEKNENTNGVNLTNRHLTLDRPNGVFTDLFLNIVSTQPTIKFERKINSFITIVKDTKPYSHKSRGSIDTFRLIIFVAIIATIFIIS